jgi:uncharacterized protein (DUF58 family)
MPILKKISKKHLLVMVLFKDTELEALALEEKETVDEIYRVTLAARKVQERDDITHKLLRQGIHAISCAPENLTIEVINKYLELKSRGII